MGFLVSSTAALAAAHASWEGAGAEESGRVVPAETKPEDMVVWVVVVLVGWGRRWVGVISQGWIAAGAAEPHTGWVVGVGSNRGICKFVPIDFIAVLNRGFT